MSRFIPYLPGSLRCPSKGQPTFDYNPAVPMKLISIACTFLAFVCVGCDVEMRRETMPSSTSLPVTGTASRLPTQTPSTTPLPPSPRPTPTPVDGATLTRVNVRAEPSTTGSVLGMIPAETRVEITGQDPGGNWW